MCRGVQLYAPTTKFICIYLLQKFLEIVLLAFIPYIKGKFCILLPDFFGINVHNKNTVSLIPELKKVL
jgi:hypothetical protein